MKTTDFKTRGTLPWSIAIVLCLLFAGSGWVLWHKRPWVSDAEKVCRVAELSGCFTDDGSIVFDRCKMMWLERTMWNFGSLAQMPRDGGPGGGDFLRLLAGEQRIELCPEAAKVDRENTAQRQREEAQVSVVRSTEELRQQVAPATHDVADWLAGGGRVMYLLLFGLAPLVAVVGLLHLRRAARRTFVPATTKPVGQPSSASRLCSLASCPSPWARFGAAAKARLQSGSPRTVASQVLE